MANESPLDGSNWGRDALLLATDDLRTISAKLIAQANLRRKEAAAKRLCYFNGQQEDYLHALLKKNFTEWDLMQQTMEFENIVKRVIKQSSLVYKDAPLRRILNADGEVMDEAQAKWDAIADQAQLNTVMKTVNRMTSLLRRMVVKIAWRDDRIQYDLITPNVLDIIVDEHDVMKPVAMVWAADPVNAVRIHTDNSGRVQMSFKEDVRFEFWSTADHPRYPGQHFMFRGDGTIIKNPENPENENPYRDPKTGKAVMPVVAFGAEYPIDDWFLEGDEDLVNAQDAVNMMLTHRAFLVKLQSYGQPVATGIEDMKQVINIGPSNLIKIPPSKTGGPLGDFKFVTPDAKILEIEKIIEGKIARVAAAYNLSMSQFRMSAAPSSGFALTLENMNLLEDREDQIEIYRPCDMELFAKTRIVHAYYKPSEAIPEDATMSIDYAEVKYPESSTERLTVLEKGVELGVDSPVDYLMECNPDLTEDEARELLENNLADRNRLRSKYGAGGLGQLAQQLGGGVKPASQPSDDNAALRHSQYALAITRALADGDLPRANALREAQAKLLGVKIAGKLTAENIASAQANGASGG